MDDMFVSMVMIVLYTAGIFMVGWWCGHESAMTCRCRERREMDRARQ